MQESQKEEEKSALKALYEVEDLLGKKTKIYSRLLMDTALAKDLEGLSKRHKQRYEALLALANGKPQKSKKEGGIFASNDEEGEE